MIEFSFEAPLNHLYDFQDDQDFIFALSFLCKDKRYIEYLKDCHKDGYKLIIDNSYNELQKATPLRTLISLYKKFNADAIICPDCDTWNWHKYRLLFGRASAILPIKDIYMVARCPEHFNYFEEIGVERIAIPYEFRPAFTGNIQYNGYPESLKCNLRGAHFLGLNTLMEPLRYQAASCDTSMPIKLALLGKTIEQWVKENCPHINSTPKFFELTLTSRQIQLAKKNIKDIKYFNQIKEKKDETSKYV